MDGLEGRTAIVTGAAQGIGAGIARAFVAAGVRVIAADIRDDDGSTLAASLGERCRFVRTDLRRDDDLDRLVDTTLATFGGIDFLLNVACSYDDHGLATDRATWHGTFDVNLIGHAMLLQRAVGALRASGAGSVVHFSSASGHFAQAGRWVYPATKAAIEQLTRSQALDLAADGIRVNALLPGWVEKAWHATAPEAVRSRYEHFAARLHMLGRMGRPQEIGEAALFLCSAHARFMTGACLRVDGGYTALGPQGRERVLPTALRAAAGAKQP